MVVHRIEPVGGGIGNVSIFLLDQMDPYAVVEQPRTVEVERGRSAEEDEAEDVGVEIDGVLYGPAEPGDVVQRHERDLRCLLLLITITIVSSLILAFFSSGIAHCCPVSLAL